MRMDSALLAPVYRYVCRRASNENDSALVLGLSTLQRETKGYAFAKHITIPESGHSPKACGKVVAVELYSIG
jgi:hypothetical protein